MFDVIDVGAVRSASEIAVDALFYFVVSFHTTCTTIWFVLAYVLSDPNVYAKLRAELTALAASGDGTLSYNDLRKSQYLVSFTALNNKLILMHSIDCGDKRVHANATSSSWGYSKSCSTIGNHI